MVVQPTSSSSCGNLFASRGPRQPVLRQPMLTVLPDSNTAENCDTPGDWALLHVMVAVEREIQPNLWMHL